MFGNVVPRRVAASGSRTRSSSARRPPGSSSTPSSTSTTSRSSSTTSRSSTATRPARSSRRSRASSCARRSARCSTPGWATAPSTTGASTASPTTGARRSTSSRWSSATRARARARAWPSAATRSTGEPEPSGDFLVNAQGEDVVSGVRNTARHRRDARGDARGPRQLMEILRTLEAHYKDMQDTEFTVEEGRLYMLQTRNAKRPAQAAVRFAVDAVRGGAADAGGGARDDRRRRARRAAAPDLRPRRRLRRCSRAASPPRRAPPRARSSSPPPRRWPPPRRARDVILVRPFTEADDVAGFHAARGHPHQRGRQGHPRGARRARHGAPGGDRRERRSRSTSTGATVARRRHGAARGRPDRDRRHHRRRHRRRRAARRARGRRGLRPVLEWADELRRLGVRANADTPAGRAQGARVRRRGHRAVPHRAHVHGRGPPAEDARDDHGRRPRRSGARALDELLPLQQEDFEGLFEAMAGCR